MAGFDHTVAEAMGLDFIDVNMGLVVSVAATVSNLPKLSPACRRS
jgi:hypothetical protein